MLEATLSPREGPLKVLCLGAHADDIEIGCGATILALCATRPAIEVRWVVFSARAEREREARRSAERFLAGAGKWHVDAHDFRDGFFPYDGAAIKERFEELKQGPSPDLVLTHWERDRHQDHRAVSQLTWNTFRDHLILEYEIPKYDGDLGTPNVFVPAVPEMRRRKVELLMEGFATQRDKRWFSPETFDGLMRLRGIESASPTGYAEGFYARKIVLTTR